MKKTVLFAVVLSVGFIHAQKVALFNGRDLTGWTSVTDYGVTGGYAASEPVWAVVDGVIRTPGTPFGYLRTKRADYANFKLHVEYRWWRETVKPNSGVFVRLARDTGAFLPACVENQLCRGQAGYLLGIQGVTFDGQAPNARHPFKVNVKKAGGNAEKPFGEWNTLEVVVSGDTLVNYVNGVEMNRCAALSAPSGAIALQAEGGAVEFRNVWIEER